MLGVHGSGLWAVGDGGQSLMAGINLSYELAPSVTALFSYYKLSTEAEQSNDFFRYSDHLASDSLSFGLVAQENSRWQYGLFATQPVRMHDSQATLSLPTRYDGRSLSYSDVDLDLVPEGQHMEYELAVSWTPDSLPVTGKFNLIRVEDYGNVVGNNDNIALFSLGFPF
ncbi:hypothetical protein N9V90_01790 [Endozoicomonas sp.]|nr:hypothetical protein [Endozoicomonas sp.]